MLDKRDIDMNEFRIAQTKLETVTKGVGEPRGENNGQAWIHQKEINERVISLIKGLEKRLTG